MHQASALYNPKTFRSPRETKAIEAAHERQHRFKAAAEAAKHAKFVLTIEAIEAKPDYRVMWFYNLVYETERNLPEILAKPSVRNVKISDIQGAVARFYGISVRDMISSRRTSEIVHPRMVATYLAKMLTPFSLPQIGRHFGNRDHTTILNAVRKIGAMVSVDSALRDDLSGIATGLGTNLG